ncbi:hypothetical protein G6F56_009796 [Rhizopus delemar]|nr:hypothetical protein G6F56_009796 [Rhizopus delemar]
MLGFFQVLVHYARLNDQRNKVFEKLIRKYEKTSIFAESLSDSRLKFQGSREDGMCLILNWKITGENIDRIEANARDNIKFELNMEVIASSEWVAKDQSGVLNKNNENDCYKKVTLGLMNDCQSLTKDATLENMKYAIMLTLCELSSARMKLPRECQTLNQPEQTTNCIQKLSASPQAWTSYSGYFRDIVLICFAIKYPLEKEILEKLHENITLNQIKNFDILHSQQKYLIQWREQEFDRLDVLRKSQIDLSRHMDQVNTYYRTTEDHIDHIMDSLVQLQNRAELSVIQYSDVITTHVDRVKKQLHEMLIYQTMEMDDVIDSLLFKLSQMDMHLEQGLLDAA